MRFDRFRASGRTHSTNCLKRALNVSAVALLVLLVNSEVRAADVTPLWSMPPVAVAEASRPISPNIFGTIALPVRAKPASSRWSKLMNASLDQAALDRLTEVARDRQPQEQIALIQSAVKQAVLTPPSSYNCSDDGYWAPASETLARGMGDCFDIAVAKMEALRYLGIPSKDLYLTTGRFGPGHDSGMGHESVALLVRVGEHFWLMTEQSDHIIEADQALTSSADFTPILTYGVGITWVHGQLIKLATLSK